MAALLSAVGLMTDGMDEAAAQTSSTWTGGAGNGTWSNASNWSTLPTTSGTWSLFFGGTTQTTSANDIGTINLSGLSFTNDGSVGQTATFTLSGSTLALSNSLITTTNASGFAPNGDSIGNRLSLSGSTTVSLGAGHNLTIAGDISGVAATLLKVDSGALYLTGSNSYSGPTYINFGNVRTGSGGASSDSNNYALGTGDVVVSGGGMLSVRNSSTVSNNIWISGTGATVGASGGAPLMGSFGASNQTAVVSGTVTLGDSTSITSWGSSGVTNSKLLLTGPIELGSNTLTFTQCVTAGATTYTEVGGAIAGTGSVIVDGTASVYLNGVNTYSGATTVRSGMLGGHGTIAGAVAVESGATIAPGSLADSTGTLSVGSLQLAAGAFASMQIGGTSVGTFDQITSIANVDFGPTPMGGNLAIDFMTGGFATGDSWQLFSGASFSGHLNSVSATGAYGTLEFTYRGNGEWNATSGLLAAGQSFSFYENSNQAFRGRFTAGQLVVVPEPSAFVIAGAGLFIAGCYHLKRRRRARSSDTRRD